MRTADIQLNLTGLLESVLECARSPRSAREKTALNCILKWIGIREINFEPVAERCAMDLLVKLSAIPVSHAIAICLNEHRRKHDLLRLPIANAIHGLVLRINECQSILLPLAVLIRNKSRTRSLSCKVPKSCGTDRNMGSNRGGSKYPPLQSGSVMIGFPVDPSNVN
jgi:hypothetical protein